MIGRLLSIFALSAFTTTLLAECPSPAIWKLADQSWKTVITKEGDYFHSTVTAVNPDGSPWILNFKIPVKGGPGQVIESTGRFESVTSKVVSPLVRENTWTRGGKQVRFDHIECSKDGRTVTGTESGVDIHGEPFHGTNVATKQ